VEYADAQAKLPQHHRDPFDRLLVAQAQADSLSLVSADGVLDQYAIKRIW
jgi:PIN domain nuclease of toxin-antitoxin system